MKQRFNALDIKAAIQELKSAFAGCRVNNIYDIDNKTYLIKLTKPEGKAMILIESGIRIHGTEFEWPKNTIPSGFSMKLRKHLRSRRLENVSQVGADRIVDLQFGSGEAAYHLIVELYDRGNILLTDFEYTIISVLRPRTDQDADVRFSVREKYPLHLAKQPEELSLDKLKEIFSSAKDNDDVRRILTTHLSYGSALIDHCLADYSDKLIVGKSFNISTDVEKLYTDLLQAERIFKQFDAGNIKGYIIEKRTKAIKLDNQKTIGDEEIVTKYRDKSTELGLGTSSNQDVDGGSSPSISPSQISPPINAYYAKHFDQSGSAKNTTNSSASNSGGTYQTITSKFKSKISLSKETQAATASAATGSSSLSNPIDPASSSSSSSPPQHLNSVAGSLFKRSKLKKLSSIGNEIKQGFDFDLPRSRLNSVHSVNDNLNSTSSSTSSSGSNSSTGSQSNNQPTFLESGVSSMIMTSPSTQPEAAVAAATHIPPATSSPIVMQQPQFVNNTLNSNSSAGAMSIASSNPNSPSVFLHNNSSSSSTSSPSDKPNGGNNSTLNNNNNLSISSSTSTPSSPTSPSSYSYLDDANLKIAIIDYQDLLKLIKQQSMIDYNEWIAFNTKMFFDQINVLYGAIADYCTPQSCPTMNGPSNQQFHWLDEKGKKCKYSAPQYIDTVLTYSAKIVDDENLFPTKVGHPFPANFDQLVKRIHKHLFQVMAHMYHSHYKELLHLQLNTNCNTIYFHMYLFAKTFNLIDDKELDIMDKLNAGLVAKYLSANGGDPLFIQSNSNSASSNTGASNTKESSSSSGGFSFFKKKLNFNLIP